MFVTNLTEIIDEKYHNKVIFFFGYDVNILEANNFIFFLEDVVNIVRFEMQVRQPSGKF